MSISPEDLSGGAWSLHLEALEAEVYLNMDEPEGPELIKRRKEVIATLDQKALTQYSNQPVSVIGTHKKTGPGQSTVLAEGEDDEGSISTVEIQQSPIEMWLHQGKTYGESNGFTILDLDEDLKFVDESDEEQDDKLQTIRDNALGRHAVAHLVITDNSGKTTMTPNDFAFVAPIVFNTVAPVTSNFLFVENRSSVLTNDQRLAEISKIFQCWTPKKTILRKKVERDIRKATDGVSALLDGLTKIKELSQETAPQDLVALTDWLAIMFKDHFFNRQYYLEGNVPRSLILEGGSRWEDFNPNSSYAVIVDGLVIAPRDKDKITEPTKGDSQVCIRMKFKTSDGSYIPVAVPLEELSSTNIKRLPNTRD